MILDCYFPLRKGYKLVCFGHRYVKKFNFTRFTMKGIFGYDGARPHNYMDDRITEVVSNFPTIFGNGNVKV